MTTATVAGGPSLSSSRWDPYGPELRGRVAGAKDHSSSRGEAAIRSQVAGTPPLKMRT